jgi:hypothetical protein
VIVFAEDRSTSRVITRCHLPECSPSPIVMQARIQHQHERLTWVVVASTLTLERSDVARASPPECRRHTGDSASGAAQAPRAGSASGRGVSSLGLDAHQDVEWRLTSLQSQCPRAQKLLQCDGGHVATWKRPARPSHRGVGSWRRSRGAHSAAFVRVPESRYVNAKPSTLIVFGVAVVLASVWPYEPFRVVEPGALQASITSPRIIARSKRPATASKGRASNPPFAAGG